MKTTIAIIRLVLRTNKVLASGESPIMLRCSYHGMKEISTGYSCSIKHWDKKNECCKKSYPNYIMINQELKKLKDRAISKRDWYIAHNEAYNPSMVLDIRQSDINANINDAPTLIQRYIQEKGLEAKTIEKWNIVSRSLVRFAGRSILINEIDESFCRRYARWLEGNGMKDGSIRSYLGKVGALCHYCIGLGLIKKYPFENWKYHKEYRECKNELYIHSRSMEVMIEMFMDIMIDRDGDLYSYKDGVIEELMDIHSSLYSLYLYVAGYICKGLSPSDISLLKKVDIKMVDVKGISCYAIDGNRSKTGMPYKIRLRKDEIINRLIIETMLMFHSGEYLLPTLEGYKGKDIKKRVNNLYTYHGDNLVEWFRRINEEIVKRNVANGDSIPLIDLDCRYYSYRHSYIMSQIQSNNVNLLKIATETGKSVKTIHQYVSYLNDEDLV